MLFHLSSGNPQALSELMREYGVQRPRMAKRLAEVRALHAELRAIKEAVNEYAERARQ